MVKKISTEEIIERLISTNDTGGKCVACGAPEDTKGTCMKHYQRVYYWLKKNGMELRQVNSYLLVPHTESASAIAKKLVWSAISKAD